MTLALPRGAIVVQPPPPLWITRLNCAEVLGLEPDQFDRFCRERWLPGERRGRTWIVPYEGACRALDGGPPASRAVTAPESGAAGDQPGTAVPATEEDPDARALRLLAKAGLAPVKPRRAPGEPSRRRDV